MSSFDIAAALGQPELNLQQKRVSHELELILASDGSSINEALGYLPKVGSKRLRSSLIISIVASLKKPLDATTIAACSAIELVHIASLIHDDIIDRSTTRWGQETYNRKHGSARAIVSGDYLLAKACQYAAHTSQSLAEAIASSICQICIGEDAELVDQYNLDRSIESLLQAVKGKTASLIASACSLAGMSAGLNAKQAQDLATFGEAFGVSFQLIDDLLDLISTPDKLGKPIWLDFSQGNYTMPIVLALKGDKAGKMKTWLKSEPLNHGPQILAVLLEDGYIAQSITQIEQYNQTAAKALTNLSGYNLDKLAGLPDKYWQWVKDHMLDKSYLATL